MKTYAEQIAAFEAKRLSHTDRMKAIMDAAARKSMQ